MSKKGAKGIFKLNSLFNIMKLLIIILFLISTGAGAIAQEVVASSGNSNSAGGITVDWTLGEPVIETLTGANNILTQGMHQSKLTVTNLDDMVIPGMEISVYPNPTKDLLKIEVESQGNELLRYELFDITGRKMVLKKMRSKSEEVDMSSYSPGIYLLNVLNQNGEHLKVCKIIKQ